MKRRLTVGDYMTTSPHTIGATQPLSTAMELYRVHRIRHLPVLDGGRLVGILSERDVLMVEALEPIDATQVAACEAMTEDPFTVAPGTSLEWVAAEMAARKLGSVVVVEDGKVVGVLTTIDALRALHDLLGNRHARRAG
jgi:acetoin utilization protein AcuB